VYGVTSEFYELKEERKEIFTEREGSRKSDAYFHNVGMTKRKGV
jgi:hypothetical protein